MKPIQIRKALENNLKGFDIDILKNKLVVFTVRTAKCWSCNCKLISAAFGLMFGMGGAIVTSINLAEVKNALPISTPHRR